MLQFDCFISVYNACNASKLNYSKGDYKGLCDYLERNLVLYDLLNNNVLDMWANIREVLDFGMKKFIPAIKNNNWKRKQSWRHPISKDIQQLISKKHRLWRHY